ncbi:unnamed protein product [Clavelina lepadiformis]|uniref:Macrophage mannose receptor 1-like n=1 Tax=Clavelina lepadiformis TaxID=159417 RepID=A0ABP0FSS7_CLALP
MDQRTWSDARAACMVGGGDLGSMNSPEENAFVNSLIKEIPTDNWFWIGGSDQNGYNIDLLDQGWRWSDGSPFNFIFWDSGEPNNVEYEDCMFIYGTKNGAWNDDDCYKYHPSVCEKKGNMDNIVGQDVTDDNCNSNEACCFKHLGAEYGGPLPDSAMSASTERDQWFTADRGRLNTPSDVIITDVEGGVSYGNGHGAWSPQFDDPNKWLQVDLPYHAEVKGIITQGRNGIIIYQERQWVTKYKVSYSQDAAGGKWEFVSDSDGNPVEFKGNSDQDTQVTNLFPRPVVARHVRCHPTEWFDAPCMRLEYIGCKTSCLKKLGMNSGLIPDNMITASTSKSGMEAKQARAPVDTDECLPSSGDSGANYRGWISKTESGLTCQAWSSQEPHRHTITSESNPTAGLINNYCRNPNSRDKPWCYTTDPNIEWQYCKIPVCPSYTPTGWAPSTASTNHYVQVQFSTFFKLSGVTLYSPPGSAYVKTYMLSFSDSDSEGSFRVYQNQNGDNQIFTGLDGTISEYTDILREPISTQYVRLMPQTWTGQPVMQFELNGCYVDNRITCSDTGNVWKDQTSTVEVNCPAGCVEDQDKGIVYGTDTYTLSSAVCPAAVHAGKVLNSHGGSVNWKQQQGISSYTGTIRNGITSLDFGPTSASFVFAGDTLRCDDGWLAWQNHCYYLSMENVKKTWHDARSHCLSMNGDLVSIISDGENSFVESQIYVADLGGDVWIGLNDLDIENYYQWSDGSPVVLTRWFWDEPKTGKHRCVNMYRFESYWNDKDCEETLPYMCKKEKELLPPPSTDTSPVDEGCEAGWSAYESSCYKASSDEYIFVYANRICEESQAKLVSIQNDFEQAFVHSLVLSTIPSGLGYTSWIGLTAKTSELGSLYYEWENGEPVQYTHWDKDEPDVRFSCAFPFIYKGVSYDTCITNDHPAGLENRPWCSVDKIYRGAWINCDTGYEYGCTYLDDKTGFWKIEVCGQNMYYVCEKPRAGYTQPVYTTPVITGTCAPGWYGDDTTSYCYQINESNDVTMRLNWFDAVDFCRAQGADLVSIHSATEEEALWNLVSQEGVYSYVYFWIGITAQDESAGYEWTDGSPVDYTNWDYGEPNDHNGNEKCGEAGLTWYSYWNDLNCDELRNWACKIPKNKDPLPPPTLPPPGGEENSPDCGFDENWIKYTTDYGTEKCYAFIDAYTFGWAYAEKNCTEKGGHLVAIHSQDENFLLLSRATRTFATTFWIGLKDTAGLDGRSFTWADGSILDYVNWVDGEPNNFEDQEDCAEMHTNSGQWNDDNCGIMNNFICEKYVGSSAVTIGPTPNIMGGCPADDAVERCNNLSAAAAVIQNSHEQAFFTSQLRSVGQNVWIGMSGQIAYIYTWQDQSEITYTNWNEFEPNGYYDDTCVEVSSSTETAGKWADTYCTDQKYFTCYAMRSSSYPDTTTPSVDCPTGYVRWGDACYKLVKQESTWDVAQAACQQEGSDVYLASITDVYENNLFKSWFWKDITSSDSVWIGLLFNATTSINDKGESSTTITLAWEDGWPVDYTHWAAGEPNSDFLVTGSGCAMLSRSGYWTTMPPSACSTTSTAYVCKKLLVPVPTTFPPPTQGNCDPGFISSENYCYYIEPALSSANYRSWHEAVYECQSRGATLASFHSLDECKQIVGAVIDITSHNMFIGLSSNGYDGWQWVDGSGVDFFNWGPGEPNGQGNGEDCVEMYPWDGKWNDVDCFNPRGYICKKAQDSSACGGLDPENRIDCGYVGIEESVCLRRSCCWDSTFMNANFSGCYYPTGNGSSNVPTGLPVTEPTGNKGGLETGAIIGIVIAVIAVIVIVGVAVYCTRSDKAKDLSMPSMPSMPSLPTSWSISKSKPTADDKVGFENPVISIDHAMESDT